VQNLDKNCEQPVTRLSPITSEINHSAFTREFKPTIQFPHKPRSKRVQITSLGTTLKSHHGICTNLSKQGVCVVCVMSCSCFYCLSMWYKLVPWIIQFMTWRNSMAWKNPSLASGDNNSHKHSQSIPSPIEQETTGFIGLCIDPMYWTRL